MERKISQIRDIKIIEKELFENPIGILAVTVNEKVIQTAVTFIYQDKNIYVFFKEGNEIYENAGTENNGSFMILKNLTGENSSKYHVISISISGAVKKVDDNKTLNDLRKIYLEKYSKNADDLFPQTELAVSLFIDTEEFLAFDEKGN